MNTLWNTLSACADTGFYTTAIMIIDRVAFDGMLNIYSLSSLQRDIYMKICTQILEVVRFLFNR